MMPIKDLARVMRLSNLGIIIVTQMLCWFFLIRPMESFVGSTLFLNFSHALILSISTALLAGAGYIINDYFDVKIDAINRPEKSLIGKDINPKTAILFHNFCNVAGLGLATYLAYQLRLPEALTIPLISTVLLWFYSTHFKRQFVIGNVVVSLLTALSILILITFEPSIWPYIAQATLTNTSGNEVINPIWILMVYSGFAFLLNWIREIIKDLEDYKGDAEDGCVTMPIKIGMRATLTFTKFLLVVSAFLLVTAIIYLVKQMWLIPALYIGLALLLPITLVYFNLGKSLKSAHFAKHSKYLKGIMLLGIFSLIIFYLHQYQ